MGNDHKSWIGKSTKKNLLALTLGLLAALLLMEVLLSFFPNKFTDYNSTYSYEPHALMGEMPVPNQNALYKGECFETAPRSNSLGFRDNEWIKDEKFKIGILGDSFMQALHAPEGTYLAAMLEKILGVQVLNAGVSGNGILHEYILYKEYIKEYNPKLVVLFFYTGNDLRDSSKALSQKFNPSVASVKPRAYIKDGDVKISAPRGDSLKYRVRNLIKRHCKSCMALYMLYLLPRYDYTMGMPLDYQVYLSPENTLWSEAWEITEHFLVLMKEEVELSGGEFVMVTIPDYMRVSDIWEDEFKRETGLSEVPEGFDPFNPLNRLRIIVDRNNIRFLELESRFNQYKDSFGLRPPYFSFRCDGHWNPLGHFLAANVLTEYLLNNHLIPLDDEKKEEINNRVKRNLGIEPSKVLGDENYSGIYSKGVFKGVVDIPGLMYLDE